MRLKVINRLHNRFFLDITTLWTHQVFCSCDLLCGVLIFSKCLLERNVNVLLYFILFQDRFEMKNNFSVHLESHQLLSRPFRAAVSIFFETKCECFISFYPLGGSNFCWFIWSVVGITVMKIDIEMIVLDWYLLNLEGEQYS